MRNFRPDKKLNRKKQWKDYLKRKRMGLPLLKFLKVAKKISPKIIETKPKKKSWFRRFWEWIKKVIPRVRS